ncbi:MAG: aminotransferase class III-fold pyridoxal phosphate-dependent enzyme [Candidatus Promineifilaceae bacterium]
MSLIQATPTFTPAEAQTIAKQLFNFSGTAVPLPSERDQNFLIQQTETGKAIVLKIANAREETSQLQAQQLAMQHIHAQNGRVPATIPTPNGSTITPIPHNGQQYMVWAITYLPGKPMGTVRRHSLALLADIGRTIGTIDRALLDFDHPAAHRRFHWDLQHAVTTINQHLPDVTDPAMQACIAQTLTLYTQEAAPRLPHLRRSIIHNDANDMNIILDAGDGNIDGRYQRVLGLIDFGDMVHSYTIADLAIAIAYAILDKPDPLAAAAAIVQGYHTALPLQEEELAIIWPFICLRLSLSVCLAAAQQKERPHDPYLSISQVPIARTLPRLLAIPPRLAEAVLRHACGLPPSPHAAHITQWLTARWGQFAVVTKLAMRNSLVLDLSPATPLLVDNPNHFDETGLTRRIFGAMAAAGTAVGIGQYDEPRLLYNAPFFVTPSGERRTVHMGLDLFVPPGTAVYAPLPGTVHAIAHNPQPQDYGTVIILRHETEEKRPFFTLYGHLSKASGEALQVGQTIAAGELFAYVGMAAENGGWPPHLHLQILTDTLGLGCDFPGVVPASQRAVWRALCPDPNLLVGIPAANFPPKTPDKTETAVRRRQKIGRSLSLSYHDPVKVTRGWMQYLYDDTGRRYLDGYNNVPHVGHAHPQVVTAGQQQMAILNTNTRYLHDLLNRYADRLTATLPEPLSVCFFVNSASEGNELALRLARAYTGKKDMVVLEAAYHGHTTGLIDISPYKHDGPGGTGAPDWVHTAPIPDTYRGLYKADDPDAGLKFAAHVAEIIDWLQTSGRGVAGFIAESLPSVGGQVVPPPGYLAAVYRAVRAAGGVCIADDVQTGYGRVGSHFYGFEMQGVVPDIVVLGKPIGNGHPIGAVITTPDIAAAFANGMEFFSTFGGNTVSCAVGLAVLDVVEQEGLQGHALAVGERLLAGLRPLLDKYPIVGDVRGSGLFLGIELVRSRETLEPADKEASFIVNQMRERGVLIGTDGPYHNVLKIRPPMPFSMDDADFLTATLDAVLAESFTPE